MLLGSVREKDEGWRPERKARIPAGGEGGGDGQNVSHQGEGQVEGGSHLEGGSGCGEEGDQCSGALMSNAARAPRGRLGQGSMKCGQGLEGTGTEQSQFLYPSRVTLLPTYTAV